MLWRQAHVTPEPLSKIDPEIPESVSELALSCLNKQPEQRPTAGELDARLLEIRESL